MDIVWWEILVTARLMPGVLLLDAFGGRYVPWPASLGLAICGAIMVFDHSGFDGTVPMGMVYLGLILKEIFVGIVFATGAGSLFYCLKMAGQIMDGTRGAARGESSVMMDGSRGSPLGMLYVLLACVVFLEIGGAQRMLEAIIESFHHVPIMSLPSGTITEQGLIWVSGAFRIAVETAVWLAGPLMFSVIFVDLVLGVVCRSAPQLPVYFIGLPLKYSLGVLIAALLLTRVAPVITQLLSAIG